MTGARVVGTVLVGSTNPSKVNPVRDVFRQVSADPDVRGVTAASGVPDQPIGYEETLRGARNRAQEARSLGAADWAVGLEGGVEFSEDGRGWLFGVVVVLHGGRESHVRTASLELPPVVVRRVRAGEELGPVMDDLSGVRESKTKGGAVGHLTSGMLVRADVWRQGLTLALAPHLHPELYDDTAGGRSSDGQAS